MTPPLRVWRAPPQVSELRSRLLEIGEEASGRKMELVERLLLAEVPTAEDLDDEQETRLTTIATADATATAADGTTVTLVATTHSTADRVGDGDGDSGEGLSTALVPAGDAASARSATGDAADSAVGARGDQSSMPPPPARLPTYAADERALVLEMSEVLRDPDVQRLGRGIATGARGGGAADRGGGGGEGGEGGGGATSVGAPTGSVDEDADTDEDGSVAGSASGSALGQVLGSGAAAQNGVAGSGGASSQASERRARYAAAAAAAAVHRAASAVGAADPSWTASAFFEGDTLESRDEQVGASSGRLGTNSEPRMSPRLESARLESAPHGSPPHKKSLACAPRVRSALRYDR